MDCFEALFPGVPQAELRAGDSTSIAGWDSIALVTLIAAVEEEFGLTIPLDSYANLTSFRAFMRYLEHD